ncbi:MAG: NADH-quinone oxidoreductase subunit M [Acidobacteria bacterium]|nr:NADH-quinone oxidoreductase subunit M [Acidobacteriota bacterium]
MNFLLNVVLFLPAAGAVALLAISRRRPRAVRMAALVFSLLAFALSIPLALFFSPSTSGMQFVTDMPWITSPSIRYHIGMDGLSLFLVLLTTFLTVLCVLISWRSVNEHVKEFHFFLLFLATAAMGVFVSLDLFLFYVFWEAALVPMYFLVGVWGHENRIYAAQKFFLYTVAGSLLMLVGILWLYQRFGTFDYEYIMAALTSGAVRFSNTEELWLFLAFFIAFAIKVPMFPLHTWLPDAHVEAPTAGSVMLAGVMLKMGTYGLIRFCLPLFPNASHSLAPAINALAIIGILYGSLVALVQPDMKKLIAYSSIAHLGFVVLGIFSFNQAALEGATYQMVNHGVSTGALFLLTGMLYDRVHTRRISDLGGLATPLPLLTAMFLVTTLSSIGLPLLNNFVGEFLILVGVFDQHVTSAILASVGVFLSAAYMLWMFQRVFYGEPKPSYSGLLDLDRREKLILLPTVALMLFMGIAPSFFLQKMDLPAAKLMDRLGQVQLEVRKDSSSKDAPAPDQTGYQIAKGEHDRP